MPPDPAASDFLSAAVLNGPSIDRRRSSEHNHAAVNGTWKVDQSRALLIPQRDYAADFAFRSRRGAVVSYEIPFLLSMMGMPPVHQTRQTAAVSSSSGSTSGVSSFFRRVVGGFSNVAGVPHPRSRERARASCLSLLTHLLLTVAPVCLSVDAAEEE